MPRQPWLADVARGAGLEVVEVDGWRDRGSEAFNPGGVVEHHTAGARTGDMPSLRILVQGRSDLPGPLCNFGVSRSGKVYVVAAGRANHAGSGGWQGMRGNSAVIGVEYENVGTGAEPWSDRVLEVGSRLTRAVMAHLRREPRFVCEHKEWAPGRKVDRHTIIGDWWRQLVAEGGDMPLTDDDVRRIVEAIPGMHLKDPRPDVGLDAPFVLAFGHMFAHVNANHRLLKEAHQKLDRIERELAALPGTPDNAAALKRIEDDVEAVRSRLESP